jgi:hypothetical protein
MVAPSLAVFVPAMLDGHPWMTAQTVNDACREHTKRLLRMVPVHSVRQEHTIQRQRQQLLPIARRVDTAIPPQVEAVQSACDIPSGSKLSFQVANLVLKVLALGLRFINCFITLYSSLKQPVASPLPRPYQFLPQSPVRFPKVYIIVEIIAV